MRIHSVSAVDNADCVRHATIVCCVYVCCQLSFRHPLCYGTVLLQDTACCTMLLLLHGSNAVNDAEMLV